MAEFHSSSIIHAPGSVLGIEELRRKILSYTSVVNLTDWPGLGRDLDNLAFKHSNDPDSFLRKIFVDYSKMESLLLCGNLSLRGPSLDKYARTWHLDVEGTDLYMFVSRQSTSLPNFNATFHLLLRSEGYSRPLRDWSRDTWRHYRNIEIQTCNGPISYNVPYFYTWTRVRVNILFYDDSLGIGTWNCIPGICMYAPGFTIIANKDLDQASEVETVQFYSFFSLPCRDLMAEVPLESVEVTGRELCRAIGCNPSISNISFTAIRQAYIPQTINFHRLLLPASIPPSAR